ncbi:MAG TPA: hypothetical protein VJQ52_10110 [Steroidobacteraceae bacterium]|nr:hypothetical protein [Steroidobacteraceae bacterium]
MPIDTRRRDLLRLSLLAAVAGVPTRGPAAPDPAAAGAAHDFDFFFGAWQVEHRRLKQRLAGSDEWEEYAGTTRCQAILGGIANFNDSVVHRAGTTYRSLGLRAFDATTNVWTDWSLDGRNPTQVTVDGVGTFHDGVGTFFADDTFERKPIRVRGIFKSLGPREMQWEQAFSADGGRTWETNYVMRYTRDR